MIRFILTIMLGLFFQTAQAADAVGQRYIDQMTRGGLVGVKQAVRSMYDTGETNEEVLDVAAEILLQRYATAGRNDLDTLAWVAKAIGSSRNPRYRSALEEVAQSNAHKKLRKYAKSALKELSGDSSQQYVKGSVDLVAARSSAQSATKTAVSGAEKSSGKESLSIIRKGMSTQEVYALVGQPTDTSTRQTGKNWNPFNVAGKDLARMIMLYKGQGRVVFTTHRYSPGFRVLEVILDPNETGYP